LAPDDALEPQIRLIKSVRIQAIQYAGLASEVGEFASLINREDQLLGILHRAELRLLELSTEAATFV
jgi:hypothetical protein